MNNSEKGKKVSRGPTDQISRPCGLQIYELSWLCTVLAGTTECDSAS